MMTYRRTSVRWVAAVISAVVCMSSIVACAPAKSTQAHSSAPSGRGEGLRARLSAGGAQRASVADARQRLDFDPKIPDQALGKKQVGSYTRADQDDVPGGVDLRGAHNVLQVLYEDDLLITEKRWEPSALRDAEEHGRGLKEGPRSSEYVTETTYRGRVLYLVDAVDLPESTDENGELLPGVSIEVSQVCWFDQGVTYIVGSPTLAPQELLVVARAIVDM